MHRKVPLDVAMEARATYRRAVLSRVLLTCTLHANHGFDDGISHFFSNSSSPARLRKPSNLNKGHYGVVEQAAVSWLVN